MQIVIDIDENVFTRLFDNGTEDYEIVNDDLFAIARAIRKGAPIPKGHGDLIDRSLLSPDSDYEDGLFYAVSIGQINNASTIIEADTESEGNE